jgi:hypothetical protein
MPELGPVIEIVGEGKTDRGRGDDQPAPPTDGVVPIFVHRLCNRPKTMRVRRRPLPFLQGKGLWQKVGLRNVNPSTVVRQGLSLSSTPKEITLVNCESCSVDVILH